MDASELKISSRYVSEGGELAIYWVNPWSHQEEKIATFWWPAHPVEATEQVERWFEKIANAATKMTALDQAEADAAAMRELMLKYVDSFECVDEGECWYCDGQEVLRSHTAGTALLQRLEQAERERDELKAAFHREKNPACDATCRNYCIHSDWEYKQELETARDEAEAKLMKARDFYAEVNRVHLRNPPWHDCGVCRAAIAYEEALKEIES